MVRARRQFNQLPAMTILLLVLLATLPVFKVSSNADTPRDHGQEQSSAASVSAAPSAQVPASVESVAAAQRPVAQLIPPPDGLQSVSFTLAESDAKRPLSGGAMLVASGEYAANGHVIVVSTMRTDNTGALSSLGTQRIELADGTPAWASAGPHGKAPNQIALLRDGLIVTLSGDLPIDDLASLASHVVVRW